MQVGIVWLRDNFQRFNRQYFDGVLPEPHFHIGRSRTRLGSLSYKRGLAWRRSLFPAKSVYKGAFTLSMSNYYDQSECQFQNVLLHEMIHLSIAASGLEDTSPHGVIFRGMMARLNREGWNISVTTSMRGTPKAYTGSSTVIMQYLVLALEMKNGTYFLSSVNPKCARELGRQLKLVPGVSHYAWYTTSDKWFEDMPKVRSFRGRKVDKETYKRKIEAMKAIDLGV